MLHLFLNCPVYRPEQPSVQDRDVGGTDIRKFRWNSDLAPLAREALIVNTDNLNRCARAVSTCELSQDGIDSAVDGMSAFLSDTLAPFCEITRSAGDHPGVTNNTHRHTTGSRNHSSVDRIHRPWFNDELLNKRRIYLNALSVFNRVKTSDNLEHLRVCKQAYKVLESRLKCQFQRTEGDMLDNLRKSNPKAFYKRFSKRRTNSGCTKDKLGIFYEHFRNIASSDAVDNTHSDSYADPEDEEAVFDELDSPITELEIVNSIKTFEKGKGPFYRFDH